MNFISAHDAPSIPHLLELATLYKANPLRDQHLGKNKTLGLIFLNPSLRTRISTQQAAKNLGMESIVFNIGSEGWAMEFDEGVVMNGNKIEHIKDAAPVLGSYFDILAIRTFPSLTNRDTDYQELFINQFIKYCGIPVVSLESATLHPLQSVADLLTLTEHFHEKRKPKVVLTWAPHIKPIPQCVANSFSQWINKWGQADFVITHPAGYALKEEFTAGATITTNQEEALAQADFVYVKNWCSYNNYGTMPAVEKNWMLTTERLQNTNQAKVMHCLPVRRNLELSEAILDSHHSIVTQQASNRVWAAQAVLQTILSTL